MGWGGAPLLGACPILSPSLANAPRVVPAANAAIAPAWRKLRREMLIVVCSSGCRLCPSACEDVLTDSLTAPRTTFNGGGNNLLTLLNNLLALPLNENYNPPRSGLSNSLRSRDPSVVIAAARPQAG